ncbi:MAG: formate dehydrogenase accessory sulfurtransferase FdhD [Candidatus Cloacimonetes bacterium]|nr:formate dehydrogenase accessory sulfurtransferase FdhD [Candidatus Cloacimonadota bacterium]
MDDRRALVEICRYDDGKPTMKTDVVARESSLTIMVNGERLVSLACLNDMMMELAWGFMFSEGIVLHRDEILDATYDRNDIAVSFRLQDAGERVRAFHDSGEKTSGCGSGLSAALVARTADFQSLSVTPAALTTLTTEFQRQSELFRETGGVHAAALTDERGFHLSPKTDGNTLRRFAEDIGRHNAVDKVLGADLLEEHHPAGQILLSSGRISSEIVKKAVRLQIALIASPSAPTSEAVRLGWEYGVYLCGFVRGKRLNVYTGFDRLFS